MNSFQKILLFFSIPIVGFSQNHFLDFAINQENDTIFGVIKDGFKEKSVLHEFNTNYKKDKIKFKSHDLRKFKKIRYNDKIYKYDKIVFEDGIYTTNLKNENSKDSISIRMGNFINFQKRLSDYVITINNDTIFGIIENPKIGKMKLIDSDNQKVTIDNKTVKSYRFHNQIYENRVKSKVAINDNKEAFLKLIYNRKVKLYEYKFENQTHNTSNIKSPSNLFYFIEKNDELVMINQLNYRKKLVNLFSDNTSLANKILNKEYDFENLYLIVKYYSESMNN